MTRVSLADLTRAIREWVAQAGEQQTHTQEGAQ